MRVLVSSHPYQHVIRLLDSYRLIFAALKMSCLSQDTIWGGLMVSLDYSSLYHSVTYPPLCKAGISQREIFEELTLQKEKFSSFFCLNCVSTFFSGFRTWPLFLHSSICSFIHSFIINPLIASGTGDAKRNKTDNNWSTHGAYILLEREGHRQ